VALNRGLTMEDFIVREQKINYSPLSDRDEYIGRIIVQSALKVHRTLGPGLLEKVYEACLSHEIKKAGLEVKRQIDLPITYDGIIPNEGLRLDVLVEDRVICELKAVEQVNPLWEAQLMSHLKLTNLRLGYLINFNVLLIKQGIKRFIM
jgi:GxxExxY protein